MMQNMRAAQLCGVRDVRVVDAPMPTVQRADDVLIRIHACGICPSDLRNYLGTGRRKGQLPARLIPGHEWVGEVLETSVAAKDLKPGDRVVVNWRVTCGQCYYCGQGLFHYCTNTAHERVQGGLCEYGIAPAANVHRLPDNVSYEEATFTEPLACCINGITMSDVKLGDDVVVIGAGPIGLLHVQLARLRGARVIVSEPLAARREKALELGAHEVIDPSTGGERQRVLELTEGRGADKVIVAVGIPQAIEQAMEWVGTCGTVNVFAGVYPTAEIPVDPNTIHYKQLVVTGSHDFTPHHFRTALKLIQYGMVRVKPLISHVMPLEQVKEAFELVASNQGLKVVVRMA
ncbi:MAG: alcohol dehydrogenase catalytic domain-containing protein [Chloroflexi bacterium]|nr:alcohol dehydrogenase catalytic domain-containing protein [Chloroflexota bacterium]